MTTNWPPSPKSLLSWIMGLVGLAIVSFLGWLAIGQVESQVVQGQHKQTLDALVVVSANNTASVGALQKNDAAQDVRLEQIGAINAKIDLLVQHQLEEAHSVPRKREAMRRAVIKVRNAAVLRGETDDPLAGVDGL